ncbi:hypothetical protein [Solitalea lacus]|uniref:hypothetical protein n=1 Tax=Solitalea lacus TaxID=2911172 RepID=UPI001EDA9937|nr:hypothetical protein [Solitalea lacus]UKJ07160.1 hypothetical protein L2B55_16735 [Solitalea lacus]
MPEFQNILTELKKDIIELAKLTFKNYKNEAETDVREFLTNSEEKLKRWTQLLAKKELTQEEFATLTKGLKDSAEMKLLKQAGLTKIRLDEFKGSLINLINDTVFNFL